MQHFFMSEKKQLAPKIPTTEIINLAEEYFAELTPGFSKMGL